MFHQKSLSQNLPPGIDSVQLSMKEHKDRTLKGNQNSKRDRRRLSYDDSVHGSNHSCGSSVCDNLGNLVEAWSINEISSVNDVMENEKDEPIIVQETELFGAKFSTLVFPTTLEQAAAEKDPEVISITPLPTLPFVSIDLKVLSDQNEVSCTRLYSDSDDESSIVAEITTPSLQKSHDWDQENSVSLSWCVKEAMNDESFSRHKKQQSTTSLDVEGLVPLCNEDIDSSDCSSEGTTNCDLDIRAPRHSFLMEYLASQYKCKDLKFPHPNQEHSTDVLTSQLTLSTVQQETLSLPSSRTHTSFRERSPSCEALSLRLLKKNEPTPSHSYQEGSAPITIASTPYLVLLQQQENRASHTGIVQNSRSHVPSEIDLVRGLSIDIAECSGVADQQSQEVEAFDFDPVLDPAESLICGRLEQSYLKHISNSFQALLLQHTDGSQKCLEWMKMHPMVCQIRYEAPVEFPNSRHCFPLHYFCAVGCVEGCQLSYRLFPEAIGLSTSPRVGLPLHYACRSPKSHCEIIRFLLKRFPEASRITQESHQTPLHMACQSLSCGLDSIELLIGAYPTASQLADSEGFTPLHYACKHGMPLAILKALHASGPAAIGAATKSWHKPLHIAVLYGCSFEVLEWLIQTDKRSVKCTLDDFSTPLHCAILGNGKFPCEKDSKKVLRALIQAFPDALLWENDKDQTPLDLAQSLNLPPSVLQILNPPTCGM